MLSSRHTWFNWQRHNGLDDVNIRLYVLLTLFPGHFVAWFARLQLLDNAHEILALAHVTIVKANMNLIWKDIHI